MMDHSPKGGTIFFFKKKRWLSLRASSQKADTLSNSSALFLSLTHIHANAVVVTRGLEATNKLTYDSVSRLENKEEQEEKEEEE